jgi:hypothetical protein
MEGITDAQVNERVKAAIKAHNATLKTRMEALKKQDTWGNPNLIAVGSKENKAYNQALTDCIRVVEYSEPTI